MTIAKELASNTEHCRMPQTREIVLLQRHTAPAKESSNNFITHTQTHAKKERERVCVCVCVCVRAYSERQGQYHQLDALHSKNTVLLTAVPMSEANQYLGDSLNVVRIPQQLLECRSRSVVASPPIHRSSMVREKVLVLGWERHVQRIESIKVSTVWHASTGWSEAMR
jgi:hypothetical protein